MANQITGKVLYIYPSQTIPSKDGSKTFTKRSIILDCTRYDQYTGERGIENTPEFEFFGDRCVELDNYQVGQIVTISFDVQGSRYKNKDGKEQIFTRVQPFKIELRQTQSVQQPVPQPQLAPQPVAQQQQYQPTQQSDGLPF